MPPLLEIKYSLTNIFRIKSAHLYVRLLVVKIVSQC